MTNSFESHLKPMLVALVVFCSLFTLSFTMKWQELWLSSLSTVAILVITITILARQGREE